MEGFESNRLAAWAMCLLALFRIHLLYGGISMRKTPALMVALGLLAVAPLTAQQFDVKPGPEHAFLKEGEGVWDAMAKSASGDSKGELQCKMALNGLWLLEHYKGEAGGVAFEGRGATSYDPAKKKFVNVWIDSMVPSPMLSEGTYDKEKKTMTLVGNMPMPDGKSMKSSITITYRDANTKVLSLKGSAPDGKEFEMVEITYKRRSK
jgi:hypothetical protein